MTSLLGLETLREIIGAFRPVEMRLRRDMRSVPAEELERIIAAIDGTLPSLTGAQRGRALLFKAQVLWWHHFRALCRHEQIAPARLGIACALEGRALLSQYSDRAGLGWADEVVRRFQGTA